jgi:hypothetical protein
VRAVTPEGDSPWSTTQAALVPSYVYLPLVIRSAPNTQSASTDLGR